MSSVQSIRNSSVPLAAKVFEVELDGVPFHVRELSARQLGEISAGDLFQRASSGDIPAATEVAARLVCYCLCDAAGKRTFEDSDLDAVRDLPWSRLEPLSEKIIEASGLSSSGGN